MALSPAGFPPPLRLDLHVSVAPLHPKHFHKGLLPARLSRHLTSWLVQSINHLQLAGTGKDGYELSPSAVCLPDLKDTLHFVLGEKQPQSKSGI